MARAKRSTDDAAQRGHAGELHQHAGGDVPQLTTQQGVVVSDDQNTLRVGARGPAHLHQPLWQRTRPKRRGLYVGRARPCFDRAGTKLTIAVDGDRSAMNYFGCVTA